MKNYAILSPIRPTFLMNQQNAFFDSHLSNFIFFFCFWLFHELVFFDEKFFTFYFLFVADHLIKYANVRPFEKLNFISEKKKT